MGRLPESFEPAFGVSGLLPFDGGEVFRVVLFHQRFHDLAVMPSEFFAVNLRYRSLDPLLKEELPADVHQDEDDDSGHHVPEPVLKLDLAVEEVPDVEINVMKFIHAIHISHRNPELRSLVGNWDIQSLVSL